MVVKISAKNKNQTKPSLRAPNSNLYDFSCFQKEINTFMWWLEKVLKVLCSSLNSGVPGRGGEVQKGS